jgi:ubiquinone/menaquinone biosynthesis C-methylase UbiE
MVRKTQNQQTSWKSASRWYDSIVGEKGHYYHREVIIPRVLHLLDLHPHDRLLDIGCGQGVFSRHIPKSIEYVGIDIATELLASARQYRSSPQHQFIHADLMRPWPLAKHLPFSHAICILALQNVENPDRIFAELAQALRKGGKAIMVLNHPCFRIPRQSRWNMDAAAQTQTRELSSYMSPQRIPIVTHPGKDETATWSFHHPLSQLTSMSHAHGFVIETIEEWCSPKQSTGAAARAENRARKEFPLFMALVLRNDGRS